MKKTILLLTISFVIFSCGNQSQNKESNQNSNQEISNDDQSKTGLSNFAVIWSTPNAELMRGHYETISTEFTKLWKEKTIENAYFDNVSNQGNQKSFPDIVFFLKAKSIKDATALLNNLTIYKEGISSYYIFPVGLLWLARNDNSIENSKNKKAFATVWETNDKNPDAEVLREQSEKILELWNEGKIENVYFDVEGVKNDNNKTDFTFFTYANSIEEVNSLCESLPVFVNNVATYKVYEVGVFWYGPFEEK